MCMLATLVFINLIFGHESVVWFLFIPGLLKSLSVVVAVGLRPLLLAG